MEASVIVENIKFSDGSELPLKAGSITIVTGPNNSGKSTFLRDLDKHFSSGRSRIGYTGIIAQSLEKKLIGRPNDFIDHFDAMNKFDDKTGKYDFSGKYSSGNKYLPATIKKAVKSGKLPNAIESAFRKFLPASERLHGSGYNNTIDAAVNQIFSDEEREIELSELFQRSFGIDLILDRTRTDGIFYLANRGDLVPHDQRLTPAFREWVKSLPALKLQGDGMRSFARLLIEIFVERQSVLMIDEPELFLHPPQIRQLAGIVVNEKSDYSQIFIATHSDDFVKGILDTAPEDLNFIRITRPQGKTNIHSLQNDSVKRLWSDPLLRTSNALSSLFHQFTIVCEGESDARFLSWSLDEMMRDDASIDYFITHCGGKQKMSSIVKSISAIGGNVLSFCDIDVLNDRSVFSNLYSAHGGDYRDVKAQHDTILTRVAERRTDVSGHYFWSEIDALKSASNTSDNISDDTRKEISSLVRRSSQWGRIKEDGAIAFVDSESLNAFGKIRESSASIGLFINPEGELESLCRSISRARKSTWLTRILERDLQSDDELENVRLRVNELALYMRDMSANST